MFNIFTPPSPEKKLRDLRYEAQRLLIEHEAAAEHHKALADMYRARIARLDTLDAPKVEQRVVVNPTLVPHATPWKVPTEGARL